MCLFFLKGFESKQARSLNKQIADFLLYRRQIKKIIKNVKIYLSPPSLRGIKFIKNYLSYPYFPYWIVFIYTISPFLPLPCPEYLLWLHSILRWGGYQGSIKPPPQPTHQLHGEPVRSTGRGRSSTMKHSVTSCAKGGTPKRYQALFRGGLKFIPQTPNTRSKFHRHLKNIRFNGIYLWGAIE